MAASSTLTLVTLAGPPVGPFPANRDGVTTIGRAADCDICLLDDAVSRKHATVGRRRGLWVITDAGSSGGTFVNGVLLPRNTPAPVGSGDLIRIGPWSFRTVVGELSARTARTHDDSNNRTQRVDRPPSADRQSRSDRRLRLLSECIGRLSSTDSEESAARTVLELALLGSGYARGAILRRVAGGTAADRVDIIASHRADAADTEAFVFSRTLIERANAGETVVLSGTSAPNLSVPSVSISGLDIHSAICVPIVVAGSITEYLYLDARGRETQVKADAAGFCEAAATAFGLAVANLKRVDLERRQRDIQTELDAAREVQQLIMPPLSGIVGPARYAVVSRPGSFVAGDLFDAIELPDGRAAFCLGDVAGHGVGAAMLMASAQAFLASELWRLPPGDGPGTVVAALNAHLARRPLAGRFLSLWIGILSTDGRLDYCDAGHGHWLCLRPANLIDRASVHENDGGIPVGIDPDAKFSQGVVMLTPQDQIVLYSDGIIEQRGPSGETFGLQRILHAVATGNSAQEDVSLVMRELDRFAGTPSLEDDATVAAIEYIAPPPPSHIPPRSVP